MEDYISLVVTATVGEWFVETALSALGYRRPPNQTQRPEWVVFEGVSSLPVGVVTRSVGPITLYAVESNGRHCGGWFEYDLDSRCWVLSSCVDLPNTACFCAPIALDHYPQVESHRHGELSQSQTDAQSKSTCRRVNQTGSLRTIVENVEANFSHEFTQPIQALAHLQRGCSFTFNETNSIVRPFFARALAKKFNTLKTIKEGVETDFSAQFSMPLKCWSSAQPRACLNETISVVSPFFAKFATAGVKDAPQKKSKPTKQTAAKPSKRSSKKQCSLKTIQEDEECDFSKEFAKPITLSFPKTSELNTVVNPCAFMQQTSQNVSTGKSVMSVTKQSSLKTILENEETDFGNEFLKPIVKLELPMLKETSAIVSPFAYALQGSHPESSATTSSKVETCTTVDTHCGKVEMGADPEWLKLFSVDLRKKSAYEVVTYEVYLENEILKHLGLYDWAERDPMVVTICNCNWCRVNIRGMLPQAEAETPSACCLNLINTLLGLDVSAFMKKITPCIEERLMSCIEEHLIANRSSPPKDSAKPKVPINKGIAVSESRNSARACQGKSKRRAVRPPRSRAGHNNKPQTEEEQKEWRQFIIAHHNNCHTGDIPHTSHRQRRGGKRSRRL